MSQGTVITSRFLSLSNTNESSQIDLAARVRNGTSLAQVLASVERIMIKEALRQSDGNYEVAASRLGLNYEEFVQRLKKVAD